MNEPTPCPSLETLRGYSAGTLSDQERGEVSAHIRGCVRCKKFVWREQSTIVDPLASRGEAEVTEATAAEATRSVAPTPFDPPAPLEDAEQDLADLFPEPQAGALGWIGEYEVRSELGRGGMGIVLKGFDAVLHRVVAIKVLSPKLATSPRARRRFLREARAAAAINHPNVVTIHAVGEHRQIPYLVMEYISGQSLRQRIRAGHPLPIIDVIRIASQVAEGLAAAHAQGVIHRDIKPANVMLEDTVERVKITDFGLAMVALDLAELTSADQVVGTPAFMSPEQVLGDQVDGRGDLFSLGCVIYAMIAGRSPFSGSHTLDVIRKVCDETPLPLHEVDPGVPRELSEIVTKLLAKEPSDRYQAAAEVADELRRLLAVLNQTAAGASDDTLPLSRAGPPVWRRRGAGRQRSWQTRVAVAVGLVGILLAVASQFWPGARDLPLVELEPEPPPRILTVAQHEPAEFRGIQEALAAASPGATIRVLDNATYAETLVLADPVGLRGLAIESPHHATIAPPETAVAGLVVNATPSVRISGFKITCARDQHGVLVYGAAEGTLLEDLRIVQAGGSPRAAIYLTAGSHGSSEHPIRLSRLSVECGALGIVLLGDAQGRPCSWVEIEDCLIRGSSVLVVLDTAVQDFKFTGNRLSGGVVGLSLNLTQAARSGNLAIRNNTFHAMRSWISFMFSSASQGSITIERNLAVHCERVDGGVLDAHAAGLRWFRENLWAPRTNADGDSPFARGVAEVRWVSTDPASPDYLRPASLPPVDGQPSDGSEPAYYGALSPAEASVPKNLSSSL